MNAKSVLKREEFVALKKGDYFKDADGWLWDVFSNDPLERDTNLPGPCKVRVRDYNGVEHVLVWDEEKKLILDADLEELLELQTF